MAYLRALLDQEINSVIDFREGIAEDHNQLKKSYLDNEFHIDIGFQGQTTKTTG